MTPEGRVKAKTKVLLSRFSGVYAFWPVQTGYGSPTLDCIGWHNGNAFAIECKAPGKHPTPRQELTINEMRLAGAAVFIVGEEYVGPGAKHQYSGLDELETWLSLL